MTAETSKLYEQIAVAQKFSSNGGPVQESIESSEAAKSSIALDIAARAAQRRESTKESKLPEPAKVFIWS